MGEPPSPETCESELDSALSPPEREERSRHRRWFREMVKLEIADQPLSWYRRRALVRFAARLNLELFEARLIIRAVEYECGHVAPAAMAEIETPVSADYLAEDHSVFSDWHVLLPFAVSIMCFVAWLVR